MILNFIQTCLNWDQIYLTTFNFIFKNTKKSLNDILNVVNALQNVQGWKTLGSKPLFEYYVSTDRCELRLRPNRSCHRRSIIAAMQCPLRARSLCRIEMHSDTTIEEHHVFCYITLVYNGCNFQFVGNCRSKMRFHNITYYKSLFKYSWVNGFFLNTKIMFFLRFEKGVLK